MRDLLSNTKPIWYAVYEGKTKEYVNGDFTGKYIKTYGYPVKKRMNLSATRGTQGFTGTGAATDYFGANVRYDRILSTHRMDLPINEHTLIWTKKPAGMPDDPPTTTTTTTGTTTPIVIDYDSAEYKVTAVAVGVDHTKYAIRSLQVDGD